MLCYYLYWGNFVTSRLNRQWYVKGRRIVGVIWITGLSGSGKTTIACGVANSLRHSGETVVLLDGDELRKVFDADNDTVHGYGREGRLRLAMKYSHLCSVIASQGLVVVIATISLFREVHAWNRKYLPNYFEVYMKVPLSELRNRDPKGIYKRFDSGELSSVAGLDLAIDEPEIPDLVIEFEAERSASIAVQEVLSEFKKRRVR